MAGGRFKTFLDSAEGIIYSATTDHQSFFPYACEVNFGIMLQGTLEGGLAPAASNGLPEGARQPPGRPPINAVDGRPESLERPQRRRYHHDGPTT